MPAPPRTSSADDRAHPATGESDVRDTDTDTAATATRTADGRPLVRDLAWSLAWAVAGATMTWSVVRFRLWIVAVYVVLALALATWLVRRGRGPRLGGPVVVPVALGAAAVVAEVVPFWTYLSDGQARALAHGVALTCVVAALLWHAPWRPGRTAAAAVAVTGAGATSAAAVVLDPAPRIDVWVTLQQAADALGRGDNFYAVTWTNSPGVQDAFTYLPWTAVALAPGRWLAGDVRWALLVLTVVTALVVVAIGRRSPAALGAATLLALAPGTVTQAEQAWTEPLLLAALAAWALAVSRDRAWLAVLPLAVGCASKQHLALLLPVLAAWPGFGWRRTIATGGLTGLLVAPWFLVSPAEFWHDTVALLVDFQPLRFANTLYIAAYNHGWTPPFWLTGLVVLGTLTAVCVVVRRRDPGLGELLRWLALLLLVANLVNKQAFYNQFWLVLGLVVVSLAVPGAPSRPEPSGPVSRPVSRRGSPAA